MARFKPGALCLIIGGPKVFNENLGATLNIVAVESCPCGCGVRGWSFEKASRPLLVLVERNFWGDIIERKYSTESHPDEWRLAESWLMPLEGDEDLKKEVATQEFEDQFNGAFPPVHANCRCTTP